MQKAYNDGPLRFRNRSLQLFQIEATTGVAKKMLLAKKLGVSVGKEFVAQFTQYFLT